MEMDNRDAGLALVGNHMGNLAETGAGIVEMHSVGFCDGLYVDFSFVLALELYFVDSVGEWSFEPVFEWHLVDQTETLSFAQVAELQQVDLLAWAVGLRADQVKYLCL